MQTELHYPSLASLDLLKALQAIDQAYAQMTANARLAKSPVLHDGSAIAALESCLTDAGFKIGVEGVEYKGLPALDRLDRVKVIRAIHQAYLQVAVNAKYRDDSPANAPVLCILAGCMVDAGHIDFPLPGEVARAA